MKKPLLISLLSILVTFNSYAQDSAKVKNDAEKEVIRTDANLNSGNTQDVLLDFFQLAFNDLTGTDKQFKFSSNLFAIKLKSNPELNIDSNFAKNTFWRNSSVEFGLKLDSSYNFNGFSFGYKLAIINGRDVALAKDLPSLVEKANATYSVIFDALSISLSKVRNIDTLTMINLELDEFFKNKDEQFKDLSPLTQNFIRKNIPYPYQHLLNDDWSFREQVVNNYKSVVDKYKNKLIWTASFNSSTYTDGFLFSNLDVSSQATANLFNIDETNNVAFDLNTKLSWLSDSLKINRDLDRSLCSFEGGLNLVLRNKKTTQSWLECKASTAYIHILSGMYPDETKDKFTLNGTLRFRLNENFWIPLEFKYDPRNANLFSYLSVKANFDWLGKKMAKN